MTKKMLDQEWDMGVDEAIEAEAQAQAICMQTRDFERAYRAFVEKRRRSSRATDGHLRPRQPPAARAVAGAGRSWTTRRS